MDTKRVLIIEGNVIYNIEPLAEFYTFKYFLTVDKEASRFRRRTRKYKRYDERYFDRYAWPFGELCTKQVMEKYKDLVILDGEAELSVIVDSVLKAADPCQNVSSVTAMVSFSS